MFQSYLAGLDTGRQRALPPPTASYLFVIASSYTLSRSIVLLIVEVEGQNPELQLLDLGFRHGLFAKAR